MCTLFPALTADILAAGALRIHGCRHCKALAGSLPLASLSMHSMPLRACCVRVDRLLQILYRVLDRRAGQRRVGCTCKAEADAEGHRGPAHRAARQPRCAALCCAALHLYPAPGCPGPGCMGKPWAAHGKAMPAVVRPPVLGEMYAETSNPWVRCCTCSHAQPSDVCSFCSRLPPSSSPTNAGRGTLRPRP